MVYVYYRTPDMKEAINFCLPPAIHYSLDQVKAMQARKDLAASWYPLVSASADFGVALSQYYQSHESFDLPGRNPFIAVVGDDLFRATGPDGFETESVKKLIDASECFYIVTGAPILMMYREVATLAAKHRNNVVLIETQPAAGRKWAALIRELSPSAYVRVGLSYGDSVDGFC